MPKTEAGFTLVELALAALLLSFLVGWTAPALRRGFRALQEETAADGFVTLAAQARQAAALGGDVQKIAFDPTGTRYGLLSRRPDTGVFASPGGREGRPRKLPDGVRARGDVLETRFFPDGTATEADFVLARGEIPFGRIVVDPGLGEARWVSLEAAGAEDR